MQQRVFQQKGGNQTFAASAIKVSYAQKAEFAKFGSCAKAAIRQRCS
jgi:hypothetical protein